MTFLERTGEACARRLRCGSPRLVLALGTGVASLALTGCGSLASESSLAAAQVRFVEVSPGSPEMDLYVNGTGAAYGLGFESFTSYLPVSAGPASFTVARSGGSQVLASAQGTLSGGHQYTTVIRHGSGSVQERVYTDQDTPAPPGEISLRVLNEIDGAEAVSFYVSAAAAAPGTNPVSVWSVGSGLASSYVTLPAAEGYTVTATAPQGGLNLPVGTVVVKAGSGSVKTVVFGGSVTAKGRSNVVGFTLTDAEPS